VAPPKLGFNFGILSGDARPQDRQDSGYGRLAHPAPSGFQVRLRPTLRITTGQVE